MKILTYLSAYFTALILAHFFVKALMKRFRPFNAAGVRGAGAVIGFLERALVLTFVLLNQYTAIGLILTAKSIARYKELDNRRFAEYFLIGTLSSVLFAILVGVAVKWLLPSSP